MGKEEKRSCPLEDGGGGGVAVREVEEGVRLGVGTEEKRKESRSGWRDEEGRKETRRTSRKGGKVRSLLLSLALLLPPDDLRKARVLRRKGREEKTHQPSRKSLLLQLL